MSILKDLQYKFKTSGIVSQLIYINVGVFALMLLLSVFSNLYGSKSTFIGEWFSLSSSFDVFITRPWTLITYGFLHGGFFHILFNCLWLFFFGRLFLEYFTPKQLLNFYIFGTIFGGIAYLVSYNYFPVFKGGNPVPLVGASSAVSAIVIGLATYIPNYQLKLRLIGYVKIWHIAAVFVFLDLVSLAGSNGGGHFAHLGGALFGFFYVNQASKQKKSGTDIFSSLFKKKKKPLKTVYKSNQRKSTIQKNTKSDTQVKIDAILDKISKSGYDTLTKEEKEFLFKQKK